MNAKAGWCILFVVVAGMGVALGLQNYAIAQLRAELQLARGNSQELARLRDQRQALERTQPTATELENLRADRAALLRLREELAVSKGNADAMARMPPPKPSPSLAGPQRREANSWKNSGRASPRATLETALWAAVGGNVDALAASISLDPNARKKAEEILGRLPAEVRAQYASPESLVALFTAKDVPTSGSMQVLAEESRGDGEVALGVVFLPENAGPAAEPGKRPAAPQPRLFKLRRDGEEWKLVVPGNAVEKYGALLTGAPASVREAK